MATREENLKKINDELEKLDDEQLEQIAGGMNWTFSDFADGNQNDYQVANQDIGKNIPQYYYHHHQ